MDPFPERSPLLGDNDLPLRLFNSKGMPVTDVDGYLLYSITGNPLGVIDVGRKIFQDSNGMPLTDAAKYISTDLKFDATRQPAEEGKDERVCCKMVYDIIGQPLTDTKRRPLVTQDGDLALVLGPRGEPVSDRFGRQIIDEVGRKLDLDCGRILDKNGKTLYLFDGQKRPLTDSSGFPLLDLSGVVLIIVDFEGKPKQTITGGDIYDSNGRKSTHSEYDPSIPPIKKANRIQNALRTKNGKIGLAFDMNGHPLTDLQGIPLSTSTGDSLVHQNLNKYTDINGNDIMIISKKVYDYYSVNGYKNSVGVPIRLFNARRYPLTDFNGTPQNHASGPILIRFDEEGDPISDWKGNEIYDACGCPMSDADFRPCRPVQSLPGNSRHNSLQKRNIQYFDCYGFPLTNRYGIALLDAQGDWMITFSSYGGVPMHSDRSMTVYDIRGLPIVDNLEHPLIGPQEEPIRLYNSDGHPLTSHKGLPLKSISGKYYLSIESNGTIVNENRSLEIYDRNLVPKNSTHEFNPTSSPVFYEDIDTLVNSDNEPLLVYDSSGYPLTDPEGVVLLDCFGKPLVKCSQNDIITTYDGSPVFDVSGNLCVRDKTQVKILTAVIFDVNNRPVTDRRGTFLLNRQGESLVLCDDFGKPFNTIYGGGIDRLPAYSIFSLPRESYVIGLGSQLFDSNDLPLTDTHGDILYTSNGIPLIRTNVNGVIISDYMGGVVYDEKGIPLSKICGCWKTQQGLPYILFDKEGLPVTDSHGKPLAMIDGSPLVISDNLGRPMTDNKNRPLQDAKGRTIGDKNFSPTAPSLSNFAIPLLEENGTGLMLFDVEGRPLTSESGRPLINSKGKLLLYMKMGLNNLLDSSKRKVYDSMGRPLGCTFGKPIFDCTGSPVQYYTNNGQPLTNSNGTPLSNIVTFDKYGRIQCKDGSVICDIFGKPLIEISKKNYCDKVLKVSNSNKELSESSLL